MTTTPRRTRATGCPAVPTGCSGSAEACASRRRLRRRGPVASPSSLLSPASLRRASSASSSLPFPLSSPPSVAASPSVPALPSPASSPSLSSSPSSPSSSASSASASKSSSSLLSSVSRGGPSRGATGDAAPSRTPSPPPQLPALPGCASGKTSSVVSQSLSRRSLISHRQLSTHSHCQQNQSSSGSSKPSRSTGGSRHRWW
mmetsp:Transcript_8036/g.27335  ORF Transcript_8036/g.27335 Transcript_8036/m.27335 type:complete len:202 (+) Transcript_8036:774-1379(+)